MTPDTQCLPAKRLATFGFLTNLVWEFAQCPILYDMAGWSFWKGTVYMSAAIAGDVLIVLGVVATSQLVLGPSVGKLIGIRGWATTVMLGFIAGVVLEWLARILDLWRYSASMPTISFAGEDVGLAPLIQIAILPAFSLYLAVRFRSANDTPSPPQT